MYRIISTPAHKFRHFGRLHAKPTDVTTDEEHAHFILWRYQILDPDSDIVARWNRIFLVTSLIALFIDPLYLYLPSVGGPGCLQTDKQLSIIVTILRSFSDLFYVLHMTMKFRTAFVAPNSRVFGRGELVTDSREIGRRYLRTDFVVDLAATLPLPQVKSMSVCFIPFHSFLVLFPQRNLFWVYLADCHLVSDSIIKIS